MRFKQVPRQSCLLCELLMDTRILAVLEMHMQHNEICNKDITLLTRHPCYLAFVSINTGSLLTEVGGFFRDEGEASNRMESKVV